MDKSTLLLLLLIAAAGGGYYTYKNSPEFRNKVDSLTSSFCKKACTGCGDHGAANSEETDKAKAALVPPAPVHPTPAPVEAKPAVAPVAKAPAAPVVAHPAPKPALVHPEPAAKVPAPATAPRPA
ncbi:MAG TPA: hypothetical protein VJJ81_03810 [Candidatus Babeliales bacterium]|nr:hypothetical protein [Candidatus Babeliales bacterium]